jgi:hypothetical protein
VNELPWPVHARVEFLLAVIVAVPAVRFEQFPSAVRLGDSAVVAVERHRADQALIDEVL